MTAPVRWPPQPLVAVAMGMRDHGLFRTLEAGAILLSLVLVELVAVRYVRESSVTAGAAPGAVRPGPSVASGGGPAAAGRQGGLSPRPLPPHPRECPDASPVKAVEQSTEADERPVRLADSDFNPAPSRSHGASHRKPPPWSRGAPAAGRPAAGTGLWSGRTDARGPIERALGHEPQALESDGIDALFGRMQRSPPAGARRKRPATQRTSAPGTPPLPQRPRLTSDGEHVFGPSLAGSPGQGRARGARPGLPSDAPVLSGLIRDDRGSLAILDGHLLRTGQAAGPYILKSIERDHVFLSNGQRRIRVDLRDPPTPPGSILQAKVTP